MRKTFFTPGIYAIVILLLGLSVASRQVSADPVADYFSGLNSFQASFSQSVIDSNGEQIQDSSGQVWIQRPGRFRWSYQTPYSQLIVADGKQLWTYDEDLEQATVKTIDEALSSTPAMLLSGFRPLAEVVSWAEDSGNDAYRWYRLTPRESDAAVEQVRIGFDKQGELALIEVKDDFGNHTRIRFSHIKRNAKLDSGLFKLQLPEGTDIIGPDT
jgi:outer membrane lipoprotein carrier protein